MLPKIFCVHDTKNAPIEFKSSDEDVRLHRDPGPGKHSYTCELKDVKAETFHQILIFTDGAWPSDNSQLEIDIHLNDQSKKLCSLKKSERTFLWCQDEQKDDYELLTSGERKLTLVAQLQGTFIDTEVKNTESPPKLSSLSEGEIMKKQNETTPEVSVRSSPKQKKMKKEPVKKDSSRVTKASRKQSENKDTEKIASPCINSKKRQMDKENSPSVTPKLKAARLRAGARIFGHEKTPPSKQALTPKLAPSSSTSSDTNTARCVQLPLREPRPSSRWGHSMCVVDDKKTILIGGQGNKMQLSKDSVWELDTDCRVWKTVDLKTEGIRPDCRTGHSATYDPTMRCIYVFGGSKNSKWFHDVHMYDLDEQKWTLVKANGKAPTRAYHSTTLYRHELWIFGGVFPRPDPQPDGCDNELHIFSPVMEGWYKPIVTGEKPLPKSGHSANLVEDRLVVFGGWDFPYCYNNVNILDLTTLDWSAPKIKGEPPKPRCWSASCTITNNRVLIHGGYDGDNPLDDAFIFDLDTSCWQNVAMDLKPSPRAGHGCVRLRSNYESQNDEDEIIIFGGGDNDSNFFSDMLSLYIPYVPPVADI